MEGSLVFRLRNNIKAPILIVLCYGSSHELVDIAFWQFVTTPSYEDRPVTKLYHNISILSEIWPIKEKSS